MVALDRIGMTSLMVLAAVTGVIATADGPACSLLGNDLVPVEDVPSAIRVGELVHQAGRLTGAALAGVTVGFLGTAAAYAANGVSFLFVASVIPFLRPVRGAVGRGGAVGDFASGSLSVREGLAFFVRRPRLMAPAGITGKGAVFGRNYQLALAVLVTGPLAGGAGSFGAVSTVLAVGGIVGAVLGARLRPSVRVVGALAAAGGLLQVVAGVAPSMAVLLVNGAADGRGRVGVGHGGDGRTPDGSAGAPAGRVLGVWGSVGTVWRLGGPPALRLLTELAGARGALVVGGLVIAGAIGSGAVVRGRRRAVPVVADVPAPAVLAA